MSTRGSLQRGSTQQSFEGPVHKWKRKLITLEDRPTVIKKNKLSLLKWVKTGEKSKIRDKDKENKYIPYEKKYHPELLSQKDTNNKSLKSSNIMETIKEEEPEITPENVEIKEEKESISSPIDKTKSQIKETIDNPENN